MAKPPIEVGIASETKAFKQGIETGVVKPLEDAQKALAELGTESAPENLEQSMVDASKASQVLKDQTEQTARSIEENAKRAYGEQKAAAEDAADSSGEAMDAVEDKALSNTARAFSSFDGTSQSFINGIQRTFGQLVQRLGDVAPEFAPIAAAAAFTVGYINQQVTQQTEKTKEWRKAVGALVGEYIAAGDSAPKALENIAAKLADLAAETNPAADGLARLLGISDRSAQSYERLAQAYAGNVEGINTAIDASERLKDTLEDESAQVDTTTNAGVARYQALLDQIDATDTYTQYLTDARDKVEAARQAEELWVRSGGPELERKAAFLGTVNDAYDELAGAVEDFLVKETDVLDTGKYIAAMEERRKKLEEYQQTLAGSTLSDSAKAYLETLGADQASILLTAYEKATEQQKTSLQGIWEEAGRENSGAYIAETTKTLAAEKVRGPAIDFDPAGDANDYRSSLEEHFRRRPVDITVRALTRYGEEIG